MPLRHHGQGVEQLAAEVARAPGFPRQRRQRLQHRGAAGQAAVPGLDAPDGHQDLLLDVELLFHARERGPVHPCLFLAAPHHGLRDAGGQIAVESGVQLGLRSIRGDHPLQRLQVDEVLHHALGEAAVLRLFAQIRQPFVERLRWSGEQLPSRRTRGPSLRDRRRRLCAPGRVAEVLVCQCAQNAEKEKQRPHGDCTSILRARSRVCLILDHFQTSNMSVDISRTSFIVRELPLCPTH